MMKQSIFPRPLAAALAAALIASMGAAPAHAAAPMVKTSAPGYFRIMLGEFEVTALSDGTTDLPVDKLLTNISPAKVRQALDKSFLRSPVETSVNAYLINTGDKLVLIDTGAGGLFGPTLGKLLANLKASGYQPEQIDEIYLTHLHPDHVGGLGGGAPLAFPNALVRAERHDADFWLSAENMARAPAEQKGFFQGAVSSLTPYIQAGKFQPFDGGVDLVPGVKSYASKGHTAGHSSYVIESKGQKLVVLGDLIHVGAVQFDAPSATLTFDSDSKAAAAERKKVFDEAARGAYLLGAAHLQFPGLGHVRADGKRYQWVPVNYTQLR